MYAYNWLYTIAEIQLLSIDQPIVVYDHNKKGKDGKKEFRKLDSLSVLQAQMRWEESKAKQDGKPIVLDFSNFNNTTND